MIHKSVLQPQDFRDKEIEALKSAALWCESPSRPEMFQQTGCVKFTAPNERKRPEWIFHHAVSIDTLEAMMDRAEYLGNGTSPCSAKSHGKPR